jgi:hypothetical protein
MPRNEHLPYPPFASLYIYLSGTKFGPEKVSEILGISPDEIHEKGEKRKNGIDEWAHGLWCLESEGKIESLDLNAHLTWLVDQLVPVKASIKELNEREDVEMVISCFWIMPSTNEEYSISPGLLNRLALVNIRIDFDIFAPRRFLSDKRGRQRKYVKKR